MDPTSEPRPHTEVEVDPRHALRRTPEQEALSMAVKAGADLVELYERQQVKLEKRVAELEGELAELRRDPQDPGPAKCRCGWPLDRCQSEDGTIPAGYNYAARLDQEPGDPCPKAGGT